MAIKNNNAHILTTNFISTNNHAAQSPEFTNLRNYILGHIYPQSPRRRLAFQYHQTHERVYQVSIVSPQPANDKAASATDVANLLAAGLMSLGITLQQAANGTYLNTLLNRLQQLDTLSHAQLSSSLWYASAATRVDKLNHEGEVTFRFKAIGTHAYIQNPQGSFGRLAPSEGHLIPARSEKASLRLTLSKEPTAGSVLVFLCLYDGDGHRIQSTTNKLVRLSSAPFNEVRADFLVPPRASKYLVAIRLESFEGEVTIHACTVTFYGTK